MAAPEIRFATVNGHRMRILEKGRGPKLGYLGGLAGVPRWSPFLDELAKDHRVIVPSLPGFPGGDGHEDLDHLIDWLAATLDLIEAAGLVGADFAASSIGALLALEIAAMSPATINRLALMAPLGLHDVNAPIPHIWARRGAELPGYLCADTDALAALQVVPDGEDAVEWNIAMARATSASGRLLWPLMDIGTAKRLHRVRQPTLLIWGGKDRILSSAYDGLFREKLAGAVESAHIDDAGHLIDVDAPVEAARLITAYLNKTTASSPREARAVAG